MSTAIIFYSKHHGNTKKVIDAIASCNDIDLFDITLDPSPDLSSYDTIGIASGIYFGKFGKALASYVEQNFPSRKKVFFIYTYGSASEHYTDEIRTLAEYHFAEVIGSFGCKGFDTFGPFKVIGGIAKGHPDAQDLQNAKAFYASLHI